MSGENSIAVIHIPSERPPTVIKRWETLVSIFMFAMITGLQQDVIPAGKWHKLVIWTIGLIAQVGLIFGKPLLIRGSNQTIRIESGHFPALESKEESK